MKTHRLQPLDLLVPIGLSLALGAVPTHAADTTARTLDWGQAAPARTPQLTAQPALGGATLEPATGKPTIGRKIAVPATAAPAAKGLFALDDRAIIIVGGKSTTAGALKRALRTELVAKAGAPKTVKGGARKLDLAALVGNGGGPKPFPSSIGPFLPNKSGATSDHTSAGAQGAQAGRLGATEAIGAPGSTGPQGMQVGRAGTTQTIAGNKAGVSLVALRCPDKGLPKISESPGKLKSGGAATLWGQCFGERPGRVEVIGQFPGGKLILPFTAWNDNAVELAVPATVRGAADHVVSVTVVSADGKSSPAVQAQFIAQRERIEVPTRLWSPTADFELSATAESSSVADPDGTNEAHAGRTARSLRVQPQCTLDTMDAVVLSGTVTQIDGWEQGPPNEAAVTISWTGVCTNVKSTTSYNYVVTEGTPEITIRSACRVAFEPRAWAYCPAGIAP